MTKQLLWELTRFSERLSAAGWVALTMCVFNLLFFVMVWLPTHAELTKLNAPEAKHLDVTKPVPTKAEFLQGFVGKFPLSVERAGSIQKMMALADSMGLSLAEISYKTEQRPDDLLMHYHIDFSLIAAYPEMRKFFTKLMADMPNASLDSIAISRESVADEIAETKVRLTLHFVTR